MRVRQTSSRLPVHFTGGLFNDSFLNNFVKGWLDRPESQIEGFAFPCSGSEQSAPRVDIKKDNDKIQIAAEIPGMKKDEIAVIVQDNILSISGERKNDREEKREGFVRREISRGSFKRSFQLPDTALGEKVSADYKDGILTLEIPIKEEAKPKKVEVKIG